MSVNLYSEAHVTHKTTYPCTDVSLVRDAEALRPYVSYVYLLDI